MGKWILRPVKTERKVNMCGLLIRAPQIWAMQKIALDKKRHQNRLMLNFFTMISEPIPMELDLPKSKSGKLTA